MQQKRLPKFSLKIAHLFFFALSLFILEGCSSVGGFQFWKKSDSQGTDSSGAFEASSLESAEADDVTASPETIDAKVRNPAASGPLESVLEIVWIAPTESVDRYRLNYGFSRDNLSQQIEILVTDLVRTSHPKHGDVFKYLLTGLPAKKVVYYSLQAGNAYGFSEPTAVNEERAR